MTEVIIPPEFVSRPVLPAASPPPSGNAPNPLTVKVPLNYWEEVNFPLNEEHLTLLASHSINLAFHPFAFDSRPTRPSTSTDFNTAYPNAPWRLVSVTGANFTSTSDQGFEDDIYCDDGSSGSIITTYPGLSEARIAYKLNSSDGALPLYHTKLAAISPEQHTGLVLGGSFQWVGQLNQNDTLQPQVYVGAASGHFNLSPARFWCHLTY